MSGKRSVIGRDTNQIQLEKLALKSGEIDKKTGRIILPKPEELDRIKQDDGYVPSDPVLFQAPKPSLNKKAIPPGFGAQAMPTVQPVENTEKPLEESPQAEGAVISSVSNVQGSLGLFLGFLLLLSLLWIGYELRQTRLSTSSLLTTINLQSSSAPGQTGAESSDIEELLDLMEGIYGDLPTMIDEVNTTVSGLKKEVESLEFEFVEPEAGEEIPVEGQ